MALLSARHSETLPSTVVAISEVVPAHNEVKLLGMQCLYGAGAKGCRLPRTCPCPAVLTRVRPAIGLQRVKRLNLHRPNLFPSYNQHNIMDHHKLIHCGSCIETGMDGKTTYSLLSILP